MVDLAEVGSCVSSFSSFGLRLERGRAKLQFASEGERVNGCGAPFKKNEPCLLQMQLPLSVKGRGKKSLRTVLLAGGGGKA